MLNSVYIENFFTILLPPQQQLTAHSTEGTYTTQRTVLLYVYRGGGGQQLGTVAYSYYCIFNTRNEIFLCRIERFTT
jgi:hypothetical protein